MSSNGDMRKVLIMLEWMATGLEIHHNEEIETVKSSMCRRRISLSKMLNWPSFENFRFKDIHIVRNLIWFRYVSILKCLFPQNKFPPCFCLFVLFAVVVVVVFILCTELRAKRIQNEIFLRFMDVWKRMGLTKRNKRVNMRDGGGGEKDVFIL